ncbi:MAG: STAS domain-containing protein [Gemmatimonadaceae bacterium]|nr:STAS domain-containing protein [Gemmatimonadaceae bacterium]
MPFRVTHDNGTTIIAIVGHLLTDNRAEFKQRALDETDHGVRRIVVDLRETEYIDSSGLGALVSVSKKLRDLAGQLWVSNLNSDLRTLFQLTRLELVLPELPDGPGTISERARAATPRQRGTGTYSGAGEDSRPNV